jgi:hypothetical protein
MLYMSEVLEVEISAEAQDYSRTVIIGGSFSTCGNCNQNANFREKSHLTVPGTKMLGLEGCGMQWTSVSSDECRQEDVSVLRPDLEWIEPTSDIMGISQETKNAISSLIGFFSVIEP